MNHIVSSCSDCPFLNVAFDYENGDQHNCNYPCTDNIFIELDHLEQPITPDNCPLKKENITIVFDDNN